MQFFWSSSEIFAWSPSCFFTLEDTEGLFSLQISKVSADNSSFLVEESLHSQMNCWARFMIWSGSSCLWE